MRRNHGFATGGKNVSTAENTTSASASVSEAFEVVRVDAQSSVVRVDGAELPFRLDDAGAWVEAEALGAWLGYERPREARTLAKRLHRDGILNDSDICCTVQQNNSERGRPSKEVWLRRKGALKLAGRSNTPRANALLDLIVTVFEAVIDKKIPTNDVQWQQCTNSIVAISRSIEALTLVLASNTQQIQEIRAQYNRRFEELEARTMPDMGKNGRISGAETKRILEAFQQIATLQVGPRVDGDKEQNTRWKRARLLADHRTRRAVRLPMGRKWSTLDTHDLNATWQCIDELREEARKVAASRAAEEARQKKLFQ